VWQSPEAREQSQGRLEEGEEKIVSDSVGELQTGEGERGISAIKEPKLELNFRVLGLLLLRLMMII